MASVLEDTSLPVNKKCLRAWLICSLLRCGSSLSLPDGSCAVASTSPPVPPSPRPDPGAHPRRRCGARGRRRLAEPSPTTRPRRPCSPRCGPGPDAAGVGGRRRGASAEGRRRRRSRSPNRRFTVCRSRFRGCPAVATDPRLLHMLLRTFIQAPRAHGLGLC
ncbi:hypothetical protein PVAP13_8KG349903 [Panicum virgatum]|uniref:Uncharacterized protein n=1 Tax=Panicum virgatum TaxID=38727 RepID=A0A8T0PJM7_PANVG|nr:hypothetical protein PVAP13_8KG349903 [Panicum virgatum]